MIKQNISAYIKRQPQLFILAGFIIIFSAAIPSFFSVGNFMNILKQNSSLSIVSCGLALVVIGGNLDLSVGSLLSLTLGVSLSMTMHNSFFAIAVPLLMALGVGVINGYIVSKFKVSSIIVTLGSLSAIAGFVQFYRKGNIIMGLPGLFYSRITDAKLLGIPSYVIIFIVLAVLYQVILTRTSYGRKLLYLGVNREAAVVAGINVKLITLISFVICSFSVGIASVLQGARLLQGSTNTGAGLEFDALTAILIGGISLKGGKGSIGSAVIGVFLLAVIINALTLLNVPFEWRNIAKGILILIAIIADVLERKRYDQ
ncbi:MAG: ABC transporter permease [Spirochaetales bacterium]|nr:MAG: ABC transporter permease [Spirochaetales bacterium]